MERRMQGLKGCKQRHMDPRIRAAGRAVLGGVHPSRWGGTGFPRSWDILSGKTEDVIRRWEVRMVRGCSGRTGGAWDWARRGESEQNSLQAVEEWGAVCRRSMARFFLRGHSLSFPLPGLSPLRRVEGPRLPPEHPQSPTVKVQAHYRARRGEMG